MVGNSSGIRPTGRTVLVLLDAVPTTYGSVALAQETILKDQLSQIRATLVDRGPLAWRKNFGDWLLRFKARLPVGSRVIMRKYAGEFVTGSDGVMYRIINDEDIYATLAVGTTPTAN